MKSKSDTATTWDLSSDQSNMSMKWNAPKEASQRPNKDSRGLRKMSSSEAEGISHVSPLDAFD